MRFMDKIVGKRSIRKPKSQSISSRKMTRKKPNMDMNMQAATHTQTNTPTNKGTPEYRRCFKINSEFQGVAKWKMYCRWCTLRRRMSNECISSGTVHNGLGAREIGTPDIHAASCHRLRTYSHHLRCPQRTTLYIVFVWPISTKRNKHHLNSTMTNVATSQSSLVFSLGKYANRMSLRDIHTL